MLKPEDGAYFRGGVTEVEPGVYRAYCYAQLESGDRVAIEQPRYEMCKSREAGIAWIEQCAANRGFDRYTLD